MSVLACSEVDESHELVTVVTVIVSSAAVDGDSSVTVRDHDSRGSDRAAGAEPHLAGKQCHRATSTKGSSSRLNLLVVIVEEQTEILYTNGLKTTLN